jgi:hypothetical protein
MEKKVIKIVTGRKTMKREPKSIRRPAEVWPVINLSKPSRDGITVA